MIKVISGQHCKTSRLFISSFAQIEFHGLLTWEFIGLKHVCFIVDTTGWNLSWLILTETRFLTYKSHFSLISQFIVFRCCFYTFIQNKSLRTVDWLTIRTRQLLWDLSSIWFDQPKWLYFYSVGWQNVRSSLLPSSQVPKHPFISGYISLIASKTIYHRKTGGGGIIEYHHQHQLKSTSHFPLCIIVKSTQ